MSISSVTKRFITEWLPISVQLWLTRKHYARIVSGVDEVHEELFSIVSKLVTYGDFVMDIGANIGTHSKSLSDLVGREGLVYAVEPLPRNFLILKYIKGCLGLENVALIRCAISKSDGWANPSIPKYASGVENYYRASLCEEEGVRVVGVETRSVDSLLKGQAKRLSFIKIDVEGHEFACTRGAVDTLRRDQPALFVEVSGNPDDPASSAAALFRLLGGLGYDAFALDNHKVHARVRGEHQSDYFFLTPCQLARLVAHGLVAPAEGTAQKATELRGSTA